MDAERAGEISQTIAERMGLASEAAMANAQAEAESMIEGLKEGIEAAARIERATIDKSISEAANLGRNWTNHKYTERISAYRNSTEEVAFIEEVADLTTALVVDSLNADGFKVVTHTNEEVDYRESAGVRPEYYDTHFSVRW